MPGRDDSRRMADGLATKFFAIAAGLLLVWLFSAQSLVSAAPTYPELTGRIVDTAALLSPTDAAEITTALEDLEKQSTDQLAVVTVKSLDGLTIEDYGIGLARKWALGQKGKDNGILLIVAPNDRKVRIEVGRRLEPMMTDTMSRLIIENAIIPAFKRGDWAGGIKAGVRDIKSVVLGDAEEVRRRAVKPPEGIDYEGLIIFLIWIAILAFIIWVNYKHATSMPQSARNSAGRRGRAYQDSPIFFPTGDSGGWSSGSDGGGWSGGGGSFGGGGATGSW